VRAEDIVFVKGTYMEDPSELEQLQTLFNSVLAQGAVIMSDNMTINGSRFSTAGLAFIVVQSASDSRIHRFHFTGFCTTIACFRTVEKGVISESVFSRNHIDGGIGMLIFGVGKCKLDGCTFTENSVNHSSMILMFSTHLYLNMTVIERNSAVHNSRQALMFAINSVCEYTNTTIRHNHSPFAPLHQFEFRSCFGFWNCTFEENKHRELLLCDGTCEFNFTNTTVFRNMGSFLTTGLNASITFNESAIIDNFSGDMPLFDIPGSQFLVLHPCYFRDNKGASVVDLRGGPGRIDMQKAEFRRNQLKEFVIGADSSSEVYLTECGFYDNMGGIGSLYSADSFLIVNKSKFAREGSFPINIHHGKAKIEANSFRNISGPALKGEQLDLTMIGGAFAGDVIGGHLDVSGTLQLHGLKFNSLKRRALSRELISICQSCKYRGKTSRRSFGVMKLSVLFFAIVVLAFSMVLFRSRIERTWQNFWNPKEL
jgi:hypothetical protein